MRLTDKIRNYVEDEYINPAKEQGKVTVRVRAGDIHKEMGLVNRMPSICEALETEIFRNQALVQVINRTGPDRGSNAEWVFKIIR